MPFSLLLCGPSTNCLSGQVTDGTALIAIHGGPGQSSAVLQGLAPLSEHVPIILYDQSHSGRSSALPTPSSGGRDGNIETTMKNYLSEVKRVLDFFAVTRAHVVGHSFGASIAIDFAQMYPKHVLSLVLLSPVVDGQWWQEDANFHRQYINEKVQDPPPPPGDPTATQELLLRWVLGPAVTMQDVQPLICQASESVYSTVWGASEDVPNGQIQRYHREEVLQQLKTIHHLPIMLGCGLLDEAPPSRMLHLASALNAVKGGTEVHVVVLPHSAHIVANQDWKYYIRTIGAFIQRQPILPIAVDSGGGLTGRNDVVDAMGAVGAGGAGGAVGAGLNGGGTGVTTTIQAMQLALKQLESDASVEKRSYPYLGRLLTLKQAPPNGLQQINADEMNALLLSMASQTMNWDLVQAVVDVWYVGGFTFFFFYFLLFAFSNRICSQQCMKY